MGGSLCERFQARFPGMNSSLPLRLKQLKIPVKRSTDGEGGKASSPSTSRFSSQVMTISGFQNKRTLSTLPFNLTSQLIKIKLISLLQFITI